MSSEETLTKVIEKNKSQNRSVYYSSFIRDIASLKPGKMIDMLMHNLMQFAPGRQSSRIIRSAPFDPPQFPDSAFYHLGDDDCQIMTDPGMNSSVHLLLGERRASSTNGSQGSGLLNRVLNELRKEDFPATILPIPIFPQILPLDPVYFHG